MLRFLSEMRLSSISFTAESCDAPSSRNSQTPLRTGRLRERRFRTSGSERLGRQGRGGARPVRPGRSGDVQGAVLEGRVPDGPGRHLGRKDQDGGIHHRPGRGVTFSAPKSVSSAALVVADRRVERGARPGREAHARLGREEHRGDPDAEPGDRPHGARRRSTLTTRVWPAARACGAGRALDFTDAPPPPVQSSPRRAPLRHAASDPRRR